jgi:1,4-alpha-glucan branching enzyme
MLISIGDSAGTTRRRKNFKKLYRKLHSTTPKRHSMDDRAQREIAFLRNGQEINYSDSRTHRSLTCMCRSTQQGNPHHFLVASCTITSQEDRRLDCTPRANIAREVLEKNELAVTQCRRNADSRPKRSAIKWSTPRELACSTSSNIESPAGPRSAVPLDWVIANIPCQANAVFSHNLFRVLKAVLAEQPS